MLAKEAMDHGALGVTIFSPSGMRTEKQLFLRPSHLPPEKLCRMDRTLVLRGSESDPIPSKKERTRNSGMGTCMLGLRGWATRPN